MRVAWRQQKMYACAHSWSKTTWTISREKYKKLVYPVSPKTCICFGPTGGRKQSQAVDHIVFQEIVHCNAHSCATTSFYRKTDLTSQTKRDNTHLNEIPRSAHSLSSHEWLIYRRKSAHYLLFSCSNLDNFRVSVRFLRLCRKRQQQVLFHRSTVATHRVSASRPFEPTRLSA